MNWKTTLVLFLLCAGLGAWVYWDLERAKERDPNLAFPLVRVSPEEISRVEMERTEPAPGGTTLRVRIVIQREGLVWRVVEPLRDFAEPTAVSEIAGKPTSCWPVAYLDPPVDPLKYGLGTDALRVTLTHPQGQTSFRLGRGYGDQRKFYAQVEGDPRIAVLPDDAAQPYLHPVNRYRRVRAMDWNPEEVVKIVRSASPSQAAQPSTENLILERAPASSERWTLKAGAESGIANPALVANLLQLSERLSIQEFSAAHAGQASTTPPWSLKDAYRFEFHLHARMDPVSLVLARVADGPPERLVLFIPERGLWCVAHAGYPDFIAFENRRWLAGKSAPTVGAEKTIPGKP